MNPGKDKLWAWFGLSRASFLTLPRVLMHEMPDKWQADMAELLARFDETWDTQDIPVPVVQGKTANGKFARYPKWLLDYRHPDRAELHRRKSEARLPLAGQVIVISGTLEQRTRLEAIEALNAMGAQISGAVLPTTDYLLAGAGAGSKLKRAETCGVPVVDEDWLNDKLAEWGQQCN